MIKKIVKRIFIFVLVCTLLASAIAVGGLYYVVVLHPGEEIRPENIQSILGKESPVFYSDGITPLGVFFDDAHRQYVSYRQIPTTFVQALVASEDNRFFEHYGFDAVSIVRAAMKNYQEGRVVQGGSTLTQQTAKNLFKRSGRSYEAKIKELLYALRLEYHYSKEQIFEFYANQFYVRGNGHGLGVAARYYFDKNVEELTLLESVFIAGSVKRPNYYNPFIRKSETSKQDVRKRVNIRVAYVLGRMRHLGMLNEKQYQDAVNSEVVFKEGQVGYALDYVMEMVKEAVATETVQEALEKNGISNLATAGLRVITSVDKGLQQDILYSLRHELSRLDIRMRGYIREEVQQELAGGNYKGDQEVGKGAFLFGRISSLPVTEKAGEENLGIGVTFVWNPGNGIIDRTGLQQALKALVKWDKNRWSEAKQSDLPLLMDQLEIGDLVWVSVRKIEDGGIVLLDLERFPKMQGGATVVQEGRIRALAGGVENRFYNRAIAAKRPMGSAFKPYLYAAALQFGWNSADLLQNSRDVFVYQDQPYFPRPDHHIAAKTVSMSWAGVRSENLASIWLLYHLCDRLSAEEFKEVAAKTGLSPRVRNGEEEPYSLYKSRIRDTYGIVLNRPTLRAAAYTTAVQHLETDFIFDNRVEEYEQLRSLQYGLNFDKYEAQIDRELLDEEEELSNVQRKELIFRKTLLQTSYLKLLELQQELNSYRHSLSQPEFDDPSVGMLSDLYYDSEQKRYIFSVMAKDDISFIPLNRQRLQAYLEGQNDEEQDRFWGKVVLDSVISADALSLVEKQVQKEYQYFKSISPYSLEVLTGVHDFRVLVGLQYLIQFGKEMGIASQLDPVLSFPLGSNVVTLLETVRVYEALTTGSVYKTIGDDDSRDLLAVLDRIETSDGEVVYRTEYNKKMVLGAYARLSLGHILENTVKFGTGRYAHKHARLPGVGNENVEGSSALDLPIPLLGKTGTANNYTNASFFGYLPSVSEGGTGMVMDKGYSVGVYVGFDDNTPMRRRTTRLTGSSGGLPTWTAIINTILREKGYGEKLDPVDLSFHGLTLLQDEMGQVNLGVDVKTGGHLVKPVVEVDEHKRMVQSITTFGTIYETGRFKPKRYYAPFWRVEESIDRTDYAYPARTGDFFPER